VLDAPGLPVWSRVLATGFPAPESPAPPAPLGGPTRFWLAPSTASRPLSHTAHGLVSVEAVATLPDHRGRALGAVAAWAATLAQPELPAVLTASDGGIGVSRRMSFLPVVRWTMWFRS
jgi:hypothetical protein